MNELRLEPPGEDVDKLVLESLFEVLKTEAQKEPLILFIRNVEKSILGNFERYIKLETLKDVRLVVIGSHTSDQQKEKVRNFFFIVSWSNCNPKSARHLMWYCNKIAAATILAIFIIIDLGSSLSTAVTGLLLLEAGLLL